VLRRSITELCASDHQNDPAILEGWLANKTPEQFRVWLDSPDSEILVAVDDAGAIAGVGGYAFAGEITLNYVNPDHRFLGVSTLLLAEMERRLVTLGTKKSQLTSTQTAHGFYHARDYVDAGPPVEWRGAAKAQPMRKTLAPE
jgi:GNAT superfamily N-acetyltransferase